jgi:hypothetical protein
VLARRADRVAQTAITEIGGDQRSAARRGNRVEQADVGMRRPAKGDHRACMTFGSFLQPGIMGAVCWYDCDPSGLQPPENLCLGLGNRFFAAKVLDVCGRDRGDHGNVRTDLHGQRGNLARVVHPHFKHAEFRTRRHPREAQRHADVVVVTLDRTVRRPARGTFQRGEDRFLDPGLADRSGDPDDPCLGAVARRSREKLKRT